MPYHYHSPLDSFLGGNSYQTSLDSHLAFELKSYIPNWLTSPTPQLLIWIISSSS